MPTHRCLPTKTPERQWVPTSDVAPDAANSRSPTERSRPRERDQSTPDTDPLDPEEGKEDSRDFASRGNAAAGRGGARRHNHTAREAHSTHHARRRPASRERPKSWTRARGTHATEGTGEAREDGWGPGSPPSPTHTPSRTAALRRGGKYRARGGVHGALSPATTTQPEPHGSAATAGRQTGSAPRDPSPNSERGGAGRGRRESKRCARGRRSGGEPSRGPFGRDPSRP